MPIPRAQPWTGPIDACKVVENASMEFSGWPGTACTGKCLLSLDRPDCVMIDGPPRVAALARSALLAADLVLIPVQPSAYDVWASQEMVAAHH
jgi:hypothetical protein